MKKAEERFVHLLNLLKYDFLSENVDLRFIMFTLFVELLFKLMMECVIGQQS